MLNRFTILLLIKLLIMPSAWASYECHTLNNELNININTEGVALKVPNLGFNSSRSTASVNKAITRENEKGFTKIFKHLGQKHVLYIQNKERPNSVEDYISIHSREGHVMTYPIECKKV